MFEEAMGDRLGPPQFTMDPQVNFEIDKEMFPEEYPESWDSLPTDQKDLYCQEVVALAELEQERSTWFSKS